MYNRDGRLVLAFSDEPGEFNFTTVPEDDLDPVECDFATLQCYIAAEETNILNFLGRSQDVEEFLDRLERSGYTVFEGRPKPQRFARL